VTDSTALSDVTTARFHGSIAGLGSTSGIRVVIGTWTESPYAAFTDVMLAEADGTRRLLAPTADVAAFVSDTYVFDDVIVGPVNLCREGAWVRVRAGDLALRYRLGRRTPLGWALRAVPPPVANSLRWSRVTDPVARLVMHGVRTRGSGGHGRTEVYAASDHHAITHLEGTWRGRDLGHLANVRPDPGFGFGSTPERPSLTTLVTTVSVPGR
jgi:hypothetical protein